MNNNRERREKQKRARERDQGALDDVRVLVDNYLHGGDGPDSPDEVIEEIDRILKDRKK